jgi:hypothetical protein
MPRQHGRGRSRSPKRVTDWVSRAIIKMGRYEDKRPVGFHVDAEGSFMLSNLMCTWVRGRNLTEEIILTEILANRRDGVIRFSVKQEAGDYRIWVHEARRSMRLGREPAQVLSYVAFLMEQGAVELDHGWATLTNIVEIMKRKRFIAAVGDADALQELILKTDYDDYDGRFTIHDGWIREIDEKDRPVAQNYCRPPRAGWNSKEKLVGAGWNSKEKLVGAGWNSKEKLVGAAWNSKEKLVGAGWNSKEKLVGAGWNSKEKLVGG